MRSLSLVLLLIAEIKAKETKEILISLDDSKVESIKKDVRSQNDRPPASSKITIRFKDEEGNFRIIRTEATGIRLKKLQNLEKENERMKLDEGKLKSCWLKGSWSVILH